MSSGKGQLSPCGTKKSVSEHLGFVRNQLQGCIPGKSSRGSESHTSQRPTLEPETGVDPGRSQILRKTPLDGNPAHGLSVLKVIQVSPAFPELGGQTSKEEFENDPRVEH